MAIRLGGFFVLILVSACCGCSGTASDPSSEQDDGDLQPYVSLAALADRSETSEIKWDAVLAAAAISNASYSSQEVEEDSLRQLGFTYVRSFEHQSSHAVVCSSDQLVVVAFRGTDDLSDWIVNADLRRESVPHGEIHRGFHEATTSLYADIIETMKEQGSETKSVCLTGHSLGGAMAVAFACKATSNEELNVNALITFGQPLLLSRDLADHVNQVFGNRYNRFVNGSDIVTRLLPKFHHAGRRIHFSGSEFEMRPPEVSSRDIGMGEAESIDPEAMTVEEFEELQAEIDSTEPSQEMGDAMAVARGRIPWLRDHSMDLYEDRIRTAGQ